MTHTPRSPSAAARSFLCAALAASPAFGRASGTPDTGRTYLLVQAMNRQCAIVASDGDRGGPFALYPCRWDGNQATDPVSDVTNDQGRWLLVPSASGSFLLRNAVNGQCLIVAENGRLGGPVVPYDCAWGPDKNVDVTNDQGRWWLVPSRNGTYVVKNVKNGQCLIVADNGRPGGPLVMYDCTWGPDKSVDVTNDQGRWILTPSREAGGSSVFFADSAFASSFSLMGVVTLPRPPITVDGVTHLPSGEVHPDVIPHPFTSGKYLMAWTPYPADSDGNALSEYPCLAESSDKLHWNLLPGSPVPVVATVSGGFIADPDILAIDEMYDPLRMQYGELRLYVQPGDDQAVHLNGKGLAYGGGTWQQMVRSPSVLRDRRMDRYLMYYDGPEAAHARWTFPGTKLSVGRATSRDGISWSTTNDAQPIMTMPDGAGLGQVWHPSVRYFDAAYYMVAAANTLGEYDRADVYVWKSLDGVNWIRSAGPVIHYTDLPVDPADPYQRRPLTAYRSTMLFEGSTLYVWVSYNVGREGAPWSTRIALFKSELSPTGKAALNYQVRDYAQGGKVILSAPRDYTSP